MLVKSRQHIKIKGRWENQPRKEKSERELKDNWRVAKCDEVWEETPNGDVKFKS